MPSLEFHPDISQEVREGYLWYESKTVGLGEDFLNELESAFNIILELPGTWHII